MSGPTTATIKRLFAVSGNQCAFPSCTLPLVDPDSGTVLGEICHIEARSPDGPRYALNQTEKERHEFENLLLLCPTHHKIVDENPEEYTVERLQEIKREHEASHAGGREPSDDIVRQFVAQPTLSPKERDQLERRYLDLLAQECSTLRTEGIAEGEVPLTGVFVMLEALRSERKTPVDQRPDLAPTPERMEHASIAKRLLGQQLRPSPEPEPPPTPIPLSEALKEQQHLVLLGEPGAGKSTTLQYVALCFARADKGWVRDHLDLNEDRIPVRVELREITARLEMALASVVAGITRIDDDQARQMVDGWLEGDRLVVLLDGLDEVPGDGRDMVIEEIRRFARSPEGKRCRVILSSRVAGYSDLGSPFGEYRLRPFGGPDEILPYVTGWLAALRGQTREQVAQEAENLVEQLTGSGNLRRITDNPLLLRLAVSVYVQIGELVHSRAALYEQYVEEVLWSRAESRAPSPVAWPLALQALAAIAWALFIDSEKTARDLADILQNEMLVEDGRELIDFFRQAMGLLVLYGEAPYVGFAHRPFHEYFIATYLANGWRQDPERTWDVLRPRLHHPDWHEPLLLTAGMLQDATPLVRRILEARSPYERELSRDLFLVIDILGDGIQVDPRLITEIEKRFSRVRPAPPVLLSWMIAIALCTVGTISTLLCTPWFISLIIGSVFLLVLSAMALGFLPQAQSLLFAPVRLLRRWVEGTVWTEATTVLAQVDRPWTMKFLVCALQDGDWRVRWEAAEALGKLGDAQAVKPLLATLRDESVYVCAVAAESLGKIGNSQALEPLLTALRDRHETKRNAAARALGWLGDTQAVGSLLAALRDKDYHVRRSAAEALKTIDDSQTVKAVESLVAALQSKEDHVSAAIEALEAIGDQRAVEPLIAVLQDKDLVARESAAKALGTLGDEQAVEPLIATMQDKDANVRQQAVKALGVIGDKQAVEPLIAALQGEDDHVRAAAAVALGAIGDVRAVKPLLAALRDEDCIEYESALDTLGVIGNKQVVEPLITALQSDDENVRRAAARALGATSDSQAVKSLITALQDRDASVRQQAAKALGVLGSKQATEPLLAAQRDSDRIVRWQSARALGAIGDVRAVESLITIMRDEGNWEYLELVGILRRVAGSRLLGALAMIIISAVLRDLDLPVESTAAVLAKLVLGIPVQDVARRAGRALWWRFTDWKMSQATHMALRQVANRLAELEPPPKTSLPQPPAFRRRWLHYVLIPLAVWVAGVLADVVAGRLGAALPANAGWLLPIALAVSSLVLVLLAERLRNE